MSNISLNIEKTLGFISKEKISRLRIKGKGLYGNIGKRYRLGK